MALRAFVWPRPVKRALGTPRVSIIIAAYNEASIIIQKLDNALALDYPHDCLEIVVASDGSDDGTDDLVAQYGAPQVKLLSLPRQGKNLTLNAAVAEANGDILVFTDADSMFAPDALHHLIAPFNDEEVGGVAGDYRHDTGAAGGANERDYWSFERTLKWLQSRAGSMTSALNTVL
ncbi:MAG: glycosyltransferase [Chloroflexi bacterium]|nr:glycosyltransferase [Chloroflexota bacterium]